MDSYFEYVTIQGDTFDMIALDAYNDEFQAGVILQANPQYVGVVVFDADVTLKIPVVTQAPASTLPPWKR